MNENLIEAQYDVTKKSKLKKFYEANKILIFSTILILIVTVASVSFYLSTKDETGAFSGKYYVPIKKTWFKDFDKKGWLKDKEGWELNIPVENFLSVSKKRWKKQAKAIEFMEKRINDQKIFPTGLYLSDFGVVSKKGKLGILLTKAAVLPAGHPR